MEKRTWKKSITLIMVITLTLLLYGSCVYGASSDLRISKTGIVKQNTSSVAKYRLSSTAHQVKNTFAFGNRVSAKDVSWKSKITSVRKVSDKRIRKILYYGYNGPESTIGESNRAWLCTSHAVSFAQGYKKGVSNMGKSFYRKVMKSDCPPEEFVVYRCVSKGANVEDVFFWKIEEEGTLSIKLAADEKDSLNGAVAKIYRSKDLSKLVCTVSSDAKGRTKTLRCKTGTYYVQLVKAPAGYLLNDAVYKVNVTSYEPTILSINLEKPQLAGRFQIRVVSGTQPDAKGLKGCRFSIYRDAKLKEQIMSAVTDEDGYIDVMLPPGRYYVRETKAPQGYILEKNVYVCKSPSVCIIRKETPYIF